MIYLAEVTATQATFVLDVADGGGGMYANNLTILLNYTGKKTI